MTIQNLFVAELADILRVQLECKCGAQLSYDPNRKIEIPINCPQCRDMWRDPHSTSLDQQAIDAFMDIIRRVCEQQKVNGRLKIKLVFNHESTGQD